MTTPNKPPAGPDETVTVRLGEEAERTVKLLPAAAAVPAPAPEAERTVKLLPAAAAVPAPAPEAEENAVATMLDPAAWATPATPAAPPPVPPLDTPRPVDATQPLDAPEPLDAVGSAEPAVGAPQDERPLADGELRRFGPGIPAAAAAVWHGGGEPERPRRRKRLRIVVGLLLLLVVLALLAWRRYSPPLAVTGVTVTTAPAGPGCDGTAVVKATVATNGHAGTVRYRWQRSDGTSSGELSQSVPRGSGQADLVLRWTFDGHGTMQATATVEILAPGQQRSAAATFTYSCP
ncbi:hypothetical protein [Kitasatospora sp. NBC_00315]|uniref:hypothetical protein n=1 Tax=Kitasatospora sp. NBC_00315 TaxID=2975963 RepID=UPI003249F1CD